MAQDEILIGAPGEMFALQVPENGGFTVTPIKSGAIQQGATGARTVDTAGSRSDYSISWEDLSEEDVSLLSQLQLQLRGSMRAIRLVLPHERNMLSASISSGLSVIPERSNMFYVASGAATLTTPLVGRRDIDAAYALSPRLTRYSQFVNGPATTAVEIEGPAGFFPRSLVPVIPGRTYTLSGYYRKTAGAATSTLGLNIRREDGDPVGQPATPTVTLSSAVWAWASVSLTIPAGWHTVSPVISLGASDTVQIGALQFEEAAARTDWTMGRGVPVISVTGLTFSYSLWPKRDATLNLIEL